MCGIAGIVSPQASSVISKMMSAICHRGPDDTGSFVEGNVAFGHQRLAIQDLSRNAHQPMISGDDRYVIVFNGEIYNHWEIREEIKDKYPFISTSDTETILYGFQEYGVDLFNKLNGIFAFAIYDKKTYDVIIVRDQFGIKPLYYSIDEESFLFSSEIKALIQVPGFNKSVSQDKIANYLYFLWSPGEDTPFEFCRKLLPGHYITLNAKDLNSFSISKYYEVPFSGYYAKKTEKEWIDELDARLTKAVERQLLSDVPIGYFLSGGLDSSLIVAIAKKLNPGVRLKCYTIGSDTNSSREGFQEDLHYAKIVASHLDVDLEIVDANVDIVNDFDKMVYYLDEPQADAAPLNVYNICKKAREQGIVVLLGGTAGDDLFSGYRRHQSLYYRNKLSILPYFIKALIQRTSSLLPYRSALNRRIKKFFSVYEFTDKSVQSASLYGWLPIDRVKKLFKNAIKFHPNQFLVNSLRNIPSESSMLNQMLYWDMKYFLTDHNLNYTDKMSMAHGVEVRVPFLDKELVEFSVLIPPELKMKGNITKYILKKVGERYLPDEIIYRPKTGFGAPVRDWIIDRLDEKIAADLSQEVIGRDGIFNYSEIQKLLVQNKKGSVDASYSIWALLAVNSWLKQFVNKRP